MQSKENTNMHGMWKTAFFNLKSCIILYVLAVSYDPFNLNIKLVKINLWHINLYNNLSSYSENKGINNYISFKGMLNKHMYVQTIT